MSLSQEIRNAFDSHSRGELERLMVKVDAMEKALPKPLGLICSACGTDRLQRPCPMPPCERCPGSGTVLS